VGLHLSGLLSDAARKRGLVAAEVTPAILIQVSVSVYILISNASLRLGLFKVRKPGGTSNHLSSGTCSTERRGGRNDVISVAILIGGRQYPSIVTVAHRMSRHGTTACLGIWACRASFLVYG